MTRLKVTKIPTFLAYIAYFTSPAFASAATQDSFVETRIIVEYEDSLSVAIPGISPCLQKDTIVITPSQISKTATCMQFGTSAGEDRVLYVRKTALDPQRYLDLIGANDWMSQIVKNGPIKFDPSETFTADDYPARITFQVLNTTTELSGTRFHPRFTAALQNFLQRVDQFDYSREGKPL